jgi:hypothetical protein
MSVTSVAYAVNCATKKRERKNEARELEKDCTTGAIAESFTTTVSGASTHLSSKHVELTLFGKDKGGYRTRRRGQQERHKDEELGSQDHATFRGGQAQTAAFRRADIVRLASRATLTRR